MESMVVLVAPRAFVPPGNPQECNCLPVLAVCAARTLEGCSVGVVDEPEVASGASELAVDGPARGAGVGGDLGTRVAGDLERQKAALAVGQGSEAAQGVARFDARDDRVAAGV